MERKPRDPGAPVNGHPVPDLHDPGDARPAEPAEGTAPARPAARRRARLRPDLFLLRGIAALGTAGVLGSLITEWHRYELPVDVEFAPEGVQPVRVYLDQLGVLGHGYLGAAIALAGCVALALFGRVSGRAQARVLGLTMAGAALACAAALLYSGDSDTIAAGGLVYASVDLDFQLHTEAGAWYGLAGVALLGLAVYLVPHPGDPRPAAGPAGDPDVDEWRQPVAPRHTDETPGGPLDLSVEPVEPFHRSADDRREPWR